MLKEILLVEGNDTTLKFRITLKVGWSWKWQLVSKYTCCFARSAIVKYRKLTFKNNTDLLSHSSGGQMFKIEVNQHCTVSETCRESTLSLPTFGDSWQSLASWFRDGSLHLAVVFAQSFPNMSESLHLCICLCLLISIKKYQSYWIRAHYPAGTSSQQMGTTVASNKGHSTHSSILA